MSRQFDPGASSAVKHGLEYGETVYRGSDLVPRLAQPPKLAVGIGRQLWGRLSPVFRWTRDSPSEASPGTPLWFQEGLVMYLAGPKPQTVAEALLDWVQNGLPNREIAITGTVNYSTNCLLFAVFPISGRYYQSGDTPPPSPYNVESTAWAEIPRKIFHPNELNANDSIEMTYEAKFFPFWDFGSGLLTRWYTELLPPWP
jgi:hypothetical protein